MIKNIVLYVFKNLQLELCNIPPGKLKKKRVKTFCVVIYLFAKNDNRGGNSFFQHCLERRLAMKYIFLLKGFQFRKKICKAIADPK